MMSMILICPNLFENRFYTGEPADLMSKPYLTKKYWHKFPCLLWPVSPLTPSHCINQYFDSFKKLHSIQPKLPNDRTVLRVIMCMVQLTVFYLLHPIKNITAVR